MARRTHNQEMRRRAYMESPLMARACSKCSLEWKALSKKWYQDEALMEGKKITTSILPLAIDLREIERWRSKKQGARRKPKGWAGTSLCSQGKVARKGRKRRRLFFL